MTMRELANATAERAVKATGTPAISVDKRLIAWWQRCVEALVDQEETAWEGSENEGYCYCVLCDSEHIGEHYPGCPFAVLYEESDG